jgi:hypothetical protein
MTPDEVESYLLPRHLDTQQAGLPTAGLDNNRTLARLP